MLYFYVELLELISMSVTNPLGLPGTRTGVLGCGTVSDKTMKVSGIVRQSITPTVSYRAQMS